MKSGINKRGREKVVWALYDAPEFSDRGLHVLRDIQPDLTQIRLGYRHLISVQQKLNTLLKSATKAIVDHQYEIFSLTSEAGAHAGSTLATLFRIADDRLALIISDPARANHDFTATLQKCYQMTATEADLVNLMLTGQSLREYADKHEISYETTRTHLKNAMKKNGWQRQGQMIVQILSRLCPVVEFSSSRNGFSDSGRRNFNSDPPIR
ncbi:helix-turn-helix transcriptional regulator [Wenzhouxiangella sp. EGI_FJ10305]|uniref:helix-turn-helix transcriptional regulator n=1 Tax=Wenzhouxiangella sp. EGI_FJ10305 TaxID=3243768 RepID=UPI0035DA0EB2